jgi:hypothetical protein
MALARCARPTSVRLGAIAVNLADLEPESPDSLVDLYVLLVCNHLEYGSQSWRGAREEL